MGAPVLAMGDGALGFWEAVRDVFAQTREERCWFHKSANVLSALPKSTHPGARAAPAETCNAEDKEHALKAVKAFAVDYEAKYPKAVAKITDDLDVLLEFFNYPAEHWVHLRTTNPIESTFATVRLRTRVTKGPGSRKAIGVTIHSLRKTYACNLKKSGGHVTTAQKLMGHSSPMVTLSIYTGFRDEEIAETGDALRKTLGL
jgi:transposase-like protein